MNKSKFLLIILSINFLTGCSLLEQHDFIVSKTLSNSEQENIYYDVFQTGPDNYTIEFKSGNGTDTIKLFESYVNDAVYTAMRFKPILKKDTLLVTTNFPTYRMVGKTKKGTLVILTYDTDFTATNLRIKSPASPSALNIY